jgi:predicted amidohydrolase YtcJ
MAFNPAWLTYAGYGMQAGGQIWSGLSAEGIGNERARQLRARANTRRAIAQRESARERELGERVVKRGVVDILSQGGTATDAASVALLAELEAEKEYRALSMLYVGEDEARGLEEQADIAESEGEASKWAGFIGAASTVMSAAGKWYTDNPPDTKTKWKADYSQPKGTKANPFYYTDTWSGSGWGGSR